eukprot:m51a1_g3851 putative wd-40 repeat-containing protein (653) ;mRNA; f:383580-386214
MDDYSQPRRGQPIWSDVRSIHGQPHGPVMCVAMSRDGRVGASGGEHGCLELWSPRDGRVVSVLLGHIAQVRCCAFSADGSMLVSGGDDRSVRVWRVRDGTQVVCLHGHGAPVLCCAFAPDGRSVLSGSLDSTGRLWNLDAHGGLCNVLHGHNCESVECVAFSEDGGLVLTGGKDHAVNVWRRDGRPVICLSGCSSPVRSCAFSPDAKRVVAGCYDGSIRSWLVQTGMLLTQFETHHVSPILDLAFSPDGSLVLSGSHDRSLRIWTASDGKQLVAFCGHYEHLLCCAILPQLSLMLSGAEDGCVRLWNIKELGGVGVHDGALSSLWYRALCAERSDGPQRAAESWKTATKVVSTLGERRARESSIAGQHIDEKRSAIVTSLSKQKRKIQELERILQEERRVMVRLEESFRQHRDEESRLRWVTQAAHESAQMEPAFKQRLGRAEEKQRDLQEILAFRSVEVLTSEDVETVLRELGLASYIDHFRRMHIDGRVLQHGVQGLIRSGLSTLADRSKLQYCLSLIPALGQLRVSAEELQTLSRQVERRHADAVLCSSWTADQTVLKLGGYGVPRDITEKFAASRITGEQLLHVTEYDLLDMGLDAQEDRDRVLGVTSSLLKAHLAALSGQRRAAVCRLSKRECVGVGEGSVVPGASE